MDVGIGIGLLEETTYDPQDGALINSNLVDYMVTVPSSWGHLVNQKIRTAATFDQPKKKPSKQEFQDLRMRCSSHR
jgi:hypothetical protein